MAPATGRRAAVSRVSECRGLGVGSVPPQSPAQRTVGTTSLVPSVSCDNNISSLHLGFVPLFHISYF